MRCSRRIIANLGSRELDVISALARASASDLRWRSFASVHGIGGAEGTASPMWVCFPGHSSRLSRVGRHTPYAESALYLARRSKLDASSERPDLPREVTGFPDEREAGGAVGVRVVVGSAEPRRGHTRAHSSRLFAGGVVASQWRVDDHAIAEVMAALYLALLDHASGLPTQFRIELSSRPIRGSSETRISSPR
jgi:hypothetical protein